LVLTQVVALTIVKPRTPVMSKLTTSRPLVITLISLLSLGISAVERLEAETPGRPKGSDAALKSRHWREAQSCGVACGYMLARLLGHDLDYKDAVDAIPIEEDGTSLSGLKDGLEAMGVSTTILRAKPKDLDRITMPVIVHMLPHREASNSVGHFLLVLKIDDRSVTYVEPNYAASIETVARSQFLRSWSGYVVATRSRKTVFERWFELVLWGVFAASISIGGFPEFRSILRRARASWKRHYVLLVAGLVGSACLAPGCAPSHPIPNSIVDVAARRVGPSDVPRLVAWNTEADLGVLPRDGAAEAIFRIENQGDAKVRLHLGSPSCRCSQAHIENETLRAGESTNVHMVMRSRPRQAGPADAQVYLEAEGGKWAEALSVHSVELGANFADYTYVIGGPPSAPRSVSVVGNVFLKASTAQVEMDVPLVGERLESVLRIRDRRLGPPTEMRGCVRRECAFTVELKAQTNDVDERRELILPITIMIDGVKSAHRVRLTILPSKNLPIAQAKRTP
jgi:predicted double-glycine peptidase